MGLLRLACKLPDQGFSDRYCTAPESAVPLDEILPDLPLEDPKPLDLVNFIIAGAGFEPAISGL